MKASDRLVRAVEIAKSFGQIDGAHHKAWVIDQMVRTLLGSGYDDWVEAMRGEPDEYGDYEYEYDEGIAP
jgi:hypothetical protein